ncbi:MAG: FAD-dependent oxidoreductase, partial [Bacteriovoracia bacterium]
PLISLTLIVRKDRAHPRGVGVLIPRGEGYRILGVLFNSSAFPDRVIDDAHASYTVMIGGTGDPRALQESDETLVQIATQETSRLFGTAIEVLEARLFRWPAAIPIYNHALLETWDAARGWAAQPGRVLFGNYTGQVSVRGMIESAAALPGRE